MPASSSAISAFGHEIIDATLAVLITGIPVLHSGILDPRVLHGDQLDHRGMQLVFVARGCGTPFQVAHVTAGLGDDQRALELAGIGRVDAKIGGQLHRTAHACRDVDKGAVRKHGGIEAGKVVIGVRHHGAEILLYQFRVFAYRLRDGAEDDSGLAQVLAERGRHRHAVEHGIHRNARQCLLFFQRDAQLVVGVQQLRIDLVETLRTRALFPGCGIIGYGLKIDGRMGDIRPLRLDQGQPVAVGLEPRLQHPFRLLLACGNQVDGLLIEARRHSICLDIGDKTVLVACSDQVSYSFFCRTHFPVCSVIFLTNLLKYCRVCAHLNYYQHHLLGVPGSACVTTLL
jgi:hypothetical protein